MWMKIHKSISGIWGDNKRAGVARFSIFAVLLALSVALISSKSSQQLTTQKHVGDHDKLTGLLNENAICPCAQPVHLFEEDRVQFYMLKKTSLGLGSVLMNSGSDSISTFCDEFGMHNVLNECSSSMLYCFGRSGLAGFQTSQLVTADLYSRTLISDLQGFCTNRVNNYQLLVQIKILKCPSGGNCNYESATYNQLARSLFAVIQAFKEDPYNTSDEYYWDAPSRIYPNTPTLFNTKDIAFKMTANYDKFVKACDPSYCDLVTSVKLWPMIITSVAQVGGVLSVALAALILLARPSLFWLHRKQKASGEDSSPDSKQKASDKDPFPDSNKKASYEDPTPDQNQKASGDENDVDEK